ncbi:hypothetical protein GCM10009039_26010 [Halocalculus aciditolerans]|uniref:Uncharacterized protein n=1 Tax=Halocalculus aciditolerans TaxID=1383812 RepID=A0A830FED4_9EURY|nr:hypothetical protein GCM10009039_26010 [Halocalculus aciditolerans]
MQRFEPPDAGRILHYLAVRRDPVKTYCQKYAMTWSTPFCRRPRNDDAVASDRVDADSDAGVDALEGVRRWILLDAHSAPGQ